MRECASANLLPGSAVSRAPPAVIGANQSARRVAALPAPAGISDSRISPYLPGGMLDVEVARREAQRVSSTRVQLRSLSQTPTVAELSRSLHLTQDEVGALPLPAAARD